MIASGILLVLVGLWLLLQTMIGQLPQRLLSWTVREPATEGGG